MTEIFEELIKISEKDSVHVGFPDDEVTEDDHTRGVIREGLILTNHFYNSCINAGIIFHGRSWSYPNYDNIINVFSGDVTLPAKNIKRKKRILVILNVCSMPPNESNFHKFDSFTPKELRNVWRAFC